MAYTTPRPDIFDMVPPNAMSVLDVGCSNGALGQGLKAARPGRRVTGIEIDPVFAAHAKEYLDDVMCADLNSMDWSTALGETRFDCIVFADVLEHLPDPNRHLAAAKSLLSPGGCVIVSMPNIRHISALYSIFIRGTFPRRARGIFDRTHLRWFTCADGGSLIRESGMAIDRVSYVIRLRDTGGDLLNRIGIRLLEPIQTFFPVREFFTYQFCIRAVIAK